MRIWVFVPPGSRSFALLYRAPCERQVMSETTPLNTAQHLLSSFFRFCRTPDRCCCIEQPSNETSVPSTLVLACRHQKGQLPIALNKTEDETAGTVSASNTQDRENDFNHPQGADGFGEAGPVTRRQVYTAGEGTSIGEGRGGQGARRSPIRGDSRPGSAPSKRCYCGGSVVSWSMIKLPLLH